MSDRLLALLEAALFASPEPIPLPRLAAALDRSLPEMQALAAALAAEYEKPERGLRLRTVAGGLKLNTKAELQEELREVVESLPAPAPLSPAALETVVVIAYKQPVSAQEVNRLRGVQNRDTIRTLLKRKLIVAAGHSSQRGRAMRYRTTRRFLIEFGLDSLAELPSRDELRHRGVISIDAESA